MRSDDRLSSHSSHKSIYTPQCISHERRFISCALFCFCNAGSERSFRLHSNSTILLRSSGSWSACCLLADRSLNRNHSKRLRENYRNEAAGYCDNYATTIKSKSASGCRHVVFLASDTTNLVGIIWRSTARDLRPWPCCWDQCKLSKNDDLLMGFCVRWAVLLLIVNAGGIEYKFQSLVCDAVIAFDFKNRGHCTNADSDVRFRNIRECVKQLSTQPRVSHRVTDDVSDLADALGNATFTWRQQCENGHEECIEIELLDSTRNDFVDTCSVRQSSHGVSYCEALCMKISTEVGFQLWCRHFTMIPPFRSISKRPLDVTKIIC